MRRRTEAPRKPPTPQELERLLLRELAAEWHLLNVSRFRSRLQPPVLGLSDASSFLGRWQLGARALEFSRAFVTSQPWTLVVEVLKHEMAHQFVHEALGVLDETAHGATFQRVCRELGVDGRAQGLPYAPSDEEMRVVERIAKLLALAESPNVHEAEAAMVAAQRLIAKHNLTPPPAGETSHGHRHLGAPTGRVYEAERMLAAILVSHFFVEAIWVSAYRPADGKRGSVLEICGRQANLDIAEYVHGFLRGTSERLWAEHKRATGLRSDRERRVYLAGVMAGFGSKLAREQKRAAGEGLVWVKDGNLGDYFKKRHPHVRHVRYSGERRSGTFSEGKKAGERIILRKAVEGATSNRGRLLGR